MAVRKNSRGNQRLKLLDRYVGVPLVALLGLRRRHAVSRDVRRIGLMKTAAIGDLALLGGLVDDTKSAFPQAELFLIAGHDNTGVAPLLGAATDHIIVVSPRSPIDAIRAIRRLDLDILIDFGSWPRFDAVLSALSSARFTAGFRTAGQFRHYAYDVTAEHRADVHERTNYERLLKTIGVVARAPARIRPAGVLDPARIPAERFAVFHPWASGYRSETREWPVERWVSLAAALAPRVGRVVITGSASDVQRTRLMVGHMAAAGLSVIDVSGQLSIVELTDLLVASELVVSVNTGVAHLAALAGVRVVTLHGPTQRVRWAPLGPRSRTIASTLPGCEYLNLGFEYDGHRLDCMDGIQVDSVEAMALELLDADAIAGPWRHAE